VIVTRVIPCLLLRSQGLVKTVRFRQPKYLGDPINVVRIFNDKEVDELVLLDITATPEGRGPQFGFIADLASECFMPLSYGGGVRSVDDVSRLCGLGVEKVAVNTRAVEHPEFVSAAAAVVGSSSVIVSIDVKRDFWGRYRVYTNGGRVATGLDPVVHAVEMERRGAGEILLNSIDRDGTMEGYDLDLIRRVTQAVGVPVVACGGAGRVEDLAAAVQQGGAAAAGAGSMFVFTGPHRAVLISYPPPEVLRALLGELS
jgi:imidazole glycerol-phosphate synthase subunit HisF